MGWKGLLKWTLRKQSVRLCIGFVVLVRDRVNKAIIFQVTYKVGSSWYSEQLLMKGSAAGSQSVRGSPSS
jgi:hypothetical protein